MGFAKKNVAVILAGGVGARLGENMPKQFIKVAGKCIIEHTIEAFERNELIDEIAIVSNPDYRYLVEEISNRNHFTKLRKILNGGQERYLSSLAAINAYDDNTQLIFHDAVRPLISNRIISDCINALEKYNAVDVAINATDTMIQVNENNEIASIPDRSTLMNGQTPQAFKRETIKSAYELALLDPNFKTTDDCSVVLKYLPNEKIYVVSGEQFNMKVTYKEDLFLLDKMFQLKRMDYEKDKGKKELFFSKVIIVIGGSYGIGKCIVKLAGEFGAKIYSFSRSNGVDVCDKRSVHDALEDVYKKEGRIDFVVNTAGLLKIQSLDNMEYNDIVTSINTNYLGSIIVAKESYRYLKDTHGSLLLFTSSSYTRGRMLYGIYSSSKSAIVNLVQALSEEWFESKVRINCICPERTKTPMRLKNFGQESDETLLDPIVVAKASLNAMISSMSGEVIDVRRV